MKNQNLAIIAIFLTVLLFVFPLVVPMENETVLLIMRIGFVVCLAATAGLILRQFFLPKDTPAAPNSNNPNPRGPLMYNVNASNGAQVAQTTGDVVQINQAPKPTFIATGNSGWEVMDDGKFDMRIYLDIKNAFNSNGLRFTVLGEGIESVGVIGGNSGFLSTGSGGKIDGGAYIECGSPTNISGIWVTSSKKIDGMNIQMDSI